MKKAHWITFFSFTGSDIYNVSTRMGRFPDLVITNNSPDNINPKLKDNVNITYTSSRPGSMDYFNIMRGGYGLTCENTLLTLHGWMRIVPEDVCEECDILNLHPGLISKYPELKGKDPQQRAFDGGYSDVGVVIHKATKELDDGEIVIEKSVKNDFNDFDSLNTKLHQLGTESWLEVLPEYIII